MRTFATNSGQALSYRLEDAGPLVVMLPGGPGLDPPAFFAHSDLPGFQRLLFCPRGTGASDPPDSPNGYRIAGYVEDLERLRRHLDVEQLTLYGSSHGGSTALAYAAAYPARVERMMLSGVPARMDASFVQALTVAQEQFQAAAPNGAERLAASNEAQTRMRSASDEQVQRRSLRTMMDCYVARPGPIETAFLEQLCAAPMNFVAAGPMAQEMTGGLDLLQHAHRILAHTLVLAGELDVRVPAGHLQQITDAIPDARLTTLTGVGHLPHVEAHEEWADTVTDFLRTR